MMKKLLLVGLALYAWVACAQVSTPAQLYPGLFKAVQMQAIFPDSKTFPDAVALKPAAEINAAYARARNTPGFDLRKFVETCFRIPVAGKEQFTADRSQGLRKHIDTLWQVLLRRPDTIQGTSLIPLPYPYIVPGGRFREIYYWDSYFTMLGLQQAGKREVIQYMVDNFAFLLDRYGLIPNGNRTYYLTRSQPPFFALMLQLLAENNGPEVWVHYRPQLLKEYAFWMKGADSLPAGKAFRHVVKMPGNVVLNRYWDESDQPREESYKEDVLAAAGALHPGDLYRDIRSAAESGWDFSSRWFADGLHVSTIQTTKLIPVDLNCLLYYLEARIADSYRLSGDTGEAAVFEQKARIRAGAINKYCWNVRQGCYTDYNWQRGSPSPQVTIAAVFPLFFNLASEEQARMVAAVIKKDFLKAGGVATTLHKTGQQWDRPNGWAPLQYITVTGLGNYHQDSLAKTIAVRWIQQIVTSFQETGKLSEKYNIELQGTAAKAGGGEYPLQDGFGWTNGVLLRLMDKYGY